MNSKLQDAEKALLDLLHQNAGGLTMDEILGKLREGMGEAELRAAVWTLRAEGSVDFDGGKLRETQTA
jgi:hypothetical protein